MVSGVKSSRSICSSLRYVIKYRFRGCVRLGEEIDQVFRES